MAHALEKTVSASEFKNRTGKYLDESGKEVVVITRYDRPSRVLVDYEEYHRLQALAKARPTRSAIRSEDLDADLVDALKSATFDHIDPDLEKLMR